MALNIFDYTKMLWAMIATINQGQLSETINFSDSQQANKVLAYAKSLIHKTCGKETIKQRALIEIRKALLDVNYYLD